LGAISKYWIPVEFRINIRLAAGWVANVKSTPLAGLLLGKAKLDSVYGETMSAIVNCATVLAVRFGRYLISRARGTAE
jgi:hypothetical protein